LEHVWKTYPRAQGEVQALADVSLEAHPGEFVAVQGKSGCGKTTLLLAAGGLLRPDEGNVVIDGDDCYGLTAGERARLRANAVGFVFQRFHLVAYLTVLENVLVGGIAALQRSSQSAAAVRRADELLERLQLKDCRDQLSTELSTGERQRTALARALFNRPRLLLADEPTGNLDEENSRTVLAHLREHAEGGGAVILATHDEKAAGLVGRVIEMSEGRLAAADAI
jgi:ABC-type lipoprotein export system ATPase subunit